MPGRIAKQTAAAQRLRLLTAEVLLQMEHLMTHPSVQAKCAAGGLTIHGWVYELNTGEVLAYRREVNTLLAL